MFLADKSTPIVRSNPATEVNRFADSLVQHVVKRLIRPIQSRLTVDNKWDEFYMGLSATTMNENGKHWQYAVARSVVQRSSALLVLKSPRMSLTRDALWHNGL